MSWWRLRLPGSFPYKFHLAILEGEGEGKLIGYYESEQGLAAARRGWRVFLHSLRHYPLHQTAIAYHRFSHRTSAEWDAQHRAWAFRLTSRPEVFQDLVSMG